MTQDCATGVYLSMAFLDAPTQIIQREGVRSCTSQGRGEVCYVRIDDPTAYTSAAFYRTLGLFIGQGALSCQGLHLCSAEEAPLVGGARIDDAELDQLTEALRGHDFVAPTSPAGMAILVVVNAVRHARDMRTFPT